MFSENTYIISILSILFKFKDIQIKNIVRKTKSKKLLYIKNEALYR